MEQNVFFTRLVKLRFGTTELRNYGLTEYRINYGCTMRLICNTNRKNLSLSFQDWTRNCELSIQVQDQHESAKLLDVKALV